MQDSAVKPVLSKYTRNGTKIGLLKQVPASYIDYSFWKDYYLTVDFGLIRQVLIYWDGPTRQVFVVAQNHIGAVGWSKGAG